MGNWGSGIYDSDSALDFLDGLNAELIQNIIYYLYPETYGEETSHEIPNILASVELLTIICKHTSISPSLSQEAIKNWRNVYLTQLRRDIETQPVRFPEGYETFQTELAVKLFDELIAVCVKN